METDAGRRWAQDSYSSSARSLDIWSAIAVLRVRMWWLNTAWTYPGGITDEKKSQRARCSARFLGFRVEGFVGMPLWHSQLLALLLLTAFAVLRIRIWAFWCQSLKALTLQFWRLTVI
jgi:hypothetical protein